MAFHFNAAVTVEEERYGDAILTALPERLVKAGALPGHPLLPRLESRGALWVAIDVGGQTLQVINTHLGLSPREQRIQAAALAGREWLGKVELPVPLMLVGDLNAISRNPQPTRPLQMHLTESRKASPTWRATPTFPSHWPLLLAIDHVFVSRSVVVEAVAAPFDPLSRIASDHLPLVVDFHMTAL